MAASLHTTLHSSQYPCALIEFPSAAPASLILKAIIAWPALERDVNWVVWGSTTNYTVLAPASSAFWTISYSIQHVYEMERSAQTWSTCLHNDCAFLCHCAHWHNIIVRVYTVVLSSLTFKSALLGVCSCVVTFLVSKLSHGVTVVPSILWTTEQVKIVKIVKNDRPKAYIALWQTTSLFFAQMLMWRAAVRILRRVLMHKTSALQPTRGVYTTTTT